MQKNKFIAGTAKGNSMYPWIKEGDLIFIKSLPWQNIVPGDIIVYKSEKGDSLIAHRVIKKYTQYLITKGDASLSLTSNEKIPKDKIVGKVLFIQKGDSRIFNLKYTAFVYYLNRYCPFLWWLIYGVIKYRHPYIFIKRAIIKMRRILFPLT